MNQFINQYTINEQIPTYQRSVSTLKTFSLILQFFFNISIHFLFMAISLFSGWQLERRIGWRAKRCAEEWERSAADGATEQGLFCVKSTWAHMNMYLPLISTLDTFFPHRLQKRHFLGLREEQIFFWLTVDVVAFLACHESYLLRLFVVVYFAFYCSEAHQF